MIPNPNTSLKLYKKIFTKVRPKITKQSFSIAYPCCLAWPCNLSCTFIPILEIWHDHPVPLSMTIRPPRFHYFLVCITSNTPVLPLFLTFFSSFYLTSC